MGGNRTQMSISEFRNQTVENRGMNAIFKLQANLEVTNPTDYCFQALQTLELDPDTLVQRGAFHKVCFATMVRNIEDFDAIASLPSAPKRDRGGQPNSGASSRVLVTPGRIALFEHGIFPSMRQSAINKGGLPGQKRRASICCALSG